jgi:hypothetical protein
VRAQNLSSLLTQKVVILKPADARGIVERGVARWRIIRCRR